MGSSHARQTHHTQNTPKKIPERNHTTPPLQKSPGDVSCKRTKNTGDAAVMLPVRVSGGLWRVDLRKYAIGAVWLLRSQKVPGTVAANQQKATESVA